MGLARIQTRVLQGIQALEVSVEVHISNGLPRFDIVGLAETEVKEARDRVRSALINSGFDFPAQRMIVSLAPADLPKASGSFDLPIALAILVASKQLRVLDLEDYELVGELSLSGEIRAVKGILPMALAIKQHHLTQGLPDNQQRKFIFPADNQAEAALVKNSALFPLQHLKQLIKLLEQRAFDEFQLKNSDYIAQEHLNYLDFKDVKGHAFARKALEIAAAGSHSLLMMGPPGSGKSMLAARLVSILPTMTEQEALESASIQSLTGQFNALSWLKRPFRHPHHTASAVALVGGSSNPKPGEISLAHHGVLFLDELPEFDRKVLEVLREPLETGEITISRAGKQASFPAKFQLITAMNPCPCGYLGHGKIACSCGKEQVNRYQAKISGPLLDRIDIQIEVPVIEHQELFSQVEGETSKSIKQRVVQARQKQIDRQNKPNSQLQGQEIETHCVLDDACLKLMQQTMDKLAWSARACHRVLKVARTIADLAQSESILMPHLAQAIQYRRALQQK